MAGLVNEPGGQIKVLPGVFAMEELVGARLKITGIVQGVGFRPFIFTLAKRYDLSGWVRNTSEGVDIEVDGAYGRIQGFIQALHNEAPPLSKIDTFEVE
jgi:hydrogenase maturation protein HypF